MSVFFFAVAIPEMLVDLVHFITYLAPISASMLCMTRS